MTTEISVESKEERVEVKENKELNPLSEFFFNNKGHASSKWHHYFDIYHHHFKKFKDAASPTNKIVLYEIGVLGGGSLMMWLNYFGKDNCIIYGIDIDPRCKAMEGVDPNIKIIIGDQGNKEFLKSITETYPKPDIIVDDGGHEMFQQINSFEVLFPFVKDNGVYLCEDTHTSYWSNFGGGKKHKNSFIEFTKDIIDSINGYHLREGGSPDEYTKICYALHYYDSIVVFDKISNKSRPACSVTGIMKW